MHKKLFVFLFTFCFSLSICIADSNYSSFEVSAYKNQTFYTTGVLNIQVKDLLSNNDITGIGSSPVRVTKIGEYFDAFSIQVKSNIKNPVTVNVSVGKFRNPKLELGLVPEVAVVSTLGSMLKSDSRIYNMDTVWFEYTPAVDLVPDSISFRFYYSYKKYSKADNTQTIEAGNYLNKQFSSIVILEQLKEDQLTFPVSTVTYKMKIREEDYSTLPEGIEFVSNVTISIGVDA